MEETFNIEAIILSRCPYKEADSRLTVFSRERGKLELIARGARKIKSKVSSHIEPLSVAKIMVVSGRQCNYVGSAFGREFFHGIRGDLMKISLASRALSLMEASCREGETGEFIDIFQAAKDFLNFLEDNPISNNDLLYHLFAFRILGLSGFAPDPDDLPLAPEEKNIFRSACLGKYEPALGKKITGGFPEVKKIIDQLLADNLVCSFIKAR